MAVASSVSPVRRLRHRLRTLLSEHPALYLPLARRRYPGPSPQVIGSDTDLVIDGYTRSATTFAVYALQLAQERPVRIAHHLHAPAQLIAAARMRVPTLVTIRAPEATILSQLVQEPYVALPDALVAYARFYTCLLPYRSRFVVGEFEDVTRDFASVVRRLNERFGTSFAEFVPTEANLRECFELMEKRFTLSRTLLGFESGMITLDEVRSTKPQLAGGSQRSDRSQPSDDSETWVPSAARSRSKALLQEQWRRDDLVELRERARYAYTRFLMGPGPGR